jgi:hypothetical protein
MVLVAPVYEEILDREALALGLDQNDTARLASPSAYVVGTLASFWLLERTLGFWS